MKITNGLDISIFGNHVDLYIMDVYTSQQVADTHTLVQNM